MAGRKRWEDSRLIDVADIYFHHPLAPPPKPCAEHPRTPISIPKSPTNKLHQPTSTPTQNMAPIALPISPTITDVELPRKDSVALPPATLKRLTAAKIDLSNGYPYRPARPLYLQDVYAIRSKHREHIDAGTRADKDKKSLFAAATEVIDLTRHIGTEIVGVQLKDLSDEQKDELALLIAERSVVFFRDQQITPQEQRALGDYYGEVEVHVITHPGTTPSSHAMPPKPPALTNTLPTPSSHKSPKSPASPASPSSGPTSRPRSANPTSATPPAPTSGTRIWCTRSSPRV